MATDHIIWTQQKRIMLKNVCVSLKYYVHTTDQTKIALNANKCIDVGLWCMKLSLLLASKQHCASTCLKALGIKHNITYYNEHTNSIQQIYCIRQLLVIKAIKSALVPIISVKYRTRDERSFII